MASNLFNKGLEKVLDRTIDFINDDIQVLLVDSGYSFDKTDEFVTDITPGTNEVTNSSGTGYSRKSLSGKAITLDSGNDRVYFDASNPSYTSINTNETLAAAIIFKQATDDTDSPLIAMIDFPDLATNGSDVELQINADGLFEVNNTIT